MKDESGLDAIISAFIRYSEFSCIKYEAPGNTIKIEIALQGDFNEDQKLKMLNNICQTMNLYYKISKIEPTLMKLDVIQPDGVTILRLYRDLRSMREEELGMFVRLLRQEYPNSLMKDDNNLLFQDFMFGDVKNSILKRINSSHNYNHIFAYRDGGRVFVFNK